MHGNLAVGFGVLADATYLGESWAFGDRLELKSSITADIQAKVNAEWQERWTDVELAVSKAGHLPENEVRAVIQAELDAFNNDNSNADMLFLAGGNEAASAGVIYVIVNGVRVCIHTYQLTWQTRGSSGAPQPWTFNRFAGTDREFSTQLFIQLSWPTPVGVDEPSL